MNGRAAGAHGVGVAEPLGALSVAQAQGYQLEMADFTVGGIGKRDRQRNAVVVGLDLGDGHGILG